MKALILAGGRGTRLASVVSDVPKPLAPVKGQPFISILIKFLVAHDVKDIVISTGHMAEKFVETLPELRKITPNILLHEEASALGTGGAARFACCQFPGEESILILNGDTFFNFDLSGFINSSSNINTIALRKINNSSRYGTVKISKGLVTEFVEKNSHNDPGIIYAGFAILRINDLMLMLNEGNSSLENDFFPALLKRASLHGKIYDGEFIDIGIPEDFETANTNFNFSSFLN